MDGNPVEVDEGFVEVDGNPVEVDEGFVVVDGSPVLVDEGFVRVDRRFVQVICHSEESATKNPVYLA